MIYPTNQITSWYVHTPKHMHKHIIKWKVNVYVNNFWLFVRLCWYADVLINTQWWLIYVCLCRVKLTLVPELYIINSCVKCWQWAMNFDRWNAIYHTGFNMEYERNVNLCLQTTWGTTGRQGSSWHLGMKDVDWIYYIVIFILFNARTRHRSNLFWIIKLHVNLDCARVLNSRNAFMTMLFASFHL